MKLRNVGNCVKGSEHRQLDLKLHLPLEYVRDMSEKLEHYTCGSSIHVEIEYYSVAYFDCFTTFKAPYLRTSVKSGAQTRYVIASIVAAFTQHV